MIQYIIALHKCIGNKMIDALFTRLIEEQTRIKKNKCNGIKEYRTKMG